VTGALGAAGVELGAYDERIAAWLTTWDPETVAVVLGWVERAHAAGRAGACPCGCTRESCGCGFECCTACPVCDSDEDSATAAAYREGRDF
jgi:hypothetical protein